MTEFRAEIRNRIATTRVELDRAREAGDDYLVEVRLGELESLSRLAADHGVEIEAPLLDLRPDDEAVQERRAG